VNAPYAAAKPPIARMDVTEKAAMYKHALDQLFIWHTESTHQQIIRSTITEDREARANTEAVSSIMQTP
jgi:hypothetical protein